MDSPATTNGEAGEEGATAVLQVASEKKQTSWSSVLTLANTAIGVGVLGFPYAFSLLGLLGGGALCLMVASLEYFTLKTLVKAAARYEAFSYQAVIQRSFGGKLGGIGAVLLSCSMVVYLYGSLVAYLILLGDVSTRLLGYLLGAGCFWAQRWVSITVPSLLFVLPLCLTRSLGALSAVSSLSIVALTYTTVMIMYLSVQRLVSHPEELHEMQLVTLTWDSVHALPMMVFAFQCHATVVQIFVELEDNPSLLRCSTERRRRDAKEEGDGPEAPLLAHSSRRYLHSSKTDGMYWVVTVALLECLIGYTLVGISGYASYPTDVQSNVLNSFPDSDVSLQMARLLMGINGIVSFPVNLFPCRQALDHLLAAALGWPPAIQASALRHYSLSLGLFAASLLVSLLVADLGVVFQMVGGTAGAIIIFVIPGAVAIRLALDGPSQGRSARMAGEDEEEDAPMGTRGAAWHQVVPGALVAVLGVMLFATTVAESLWMPAAS